ncbi:hypothetical protein mRhiFer1_008519 [Rhinolophus ferrumequinum]|uniref:Uncharacterized protein n=1 Tax=Rhinolophus ferrumequinum TaxID=59479 RepID=A0A7J7UXI7_RHIFE|nr:hypothetical protein mRhiFer1_008519 [Rhinolophus ferrumequinum]
MEEDSAPSPGDGAYPAGASETGFSFKGVPLTMEGTSGPQQQNPRGFWCCPKGNFSADERDDGAEAKSIRTAGTAEPFLEGGPFYQNQRREVGRASIWPQTQLDTHRRAQIPSRRLVLLHIHGRKSGPRTTALDSEILDPGVIRAFCKFLQMILAQRGMANRQ